MIESKIEVLKKILNEIKMNTDKIQEDVTRTIEIISPTEFDIMQGNEKFKNVKLERNRVMSIDQMRSADSRFTNSDTTPKKSPGKNPKSPPTTPTTPTSPNKTDDNPIDNISTEAGFTDDK